MSGLMNKDLLEHSHACALTYCLAAAAPPQPAGSHDRDGAVCERVPSGPVQVHPQLSQPFVTWSLGISNVAVGVSVADTQGQVLFLAIVQ